MTKMPRVDLEKKIERILKITKENEKKIAKIYRWNRLRQIFFWIKTTVIIFAIVSTWIYLPAIAGALITPYQELMKNYNNTIESLDGIGTLKDSFLK